MPKLFDGYAKDDRILGRPEAWRRLCNGFDHGEIARQLMLALCAPAIEA
jgi:hypothetical protein